MPLQRTWKPDRDWNQALRYTGEIRLQSCSELENPIGIETKLSVLARRRSWSCSELENPIGIETCLDLPFALLAPPGCSELENPIGIETLWEAPIYSASLSCSELENPIGIETDWLQLSFIIIAKLQRTWKPDRDWNRVIRCPQTDLPKVAANLKTR